MLVVEFLARGGWPMLPIYACSMAAVAVFLQKLLSYRRHKIGYLGCFDWLDDVLAALADGDLEDALQRARGSGASSVQAAIAAWSHSPERSAAEARRAGSMELADVERGLRLLSFVAQAAPLLGLLGTVIGIVRLFVDLESSGTNITAAVISTGIWTALLTTAAGLIVALVALSAYTYLGGRSDRFRLDMGDAAERVLTSLCRHHPHGDRRGV